MKHLESIHNFLNEDIELYHGTVYNFEFFDTTNIGSGDGNSVQGYGFYFSEDPRVARTYADRIKIGKHKKMFLYTVSIRRTNFLEWESTILEEDANTILKKYKKIETDEQLISDLEDALGLSESYYGSFTLTRYLYDYLTETLGGKKEASEFLNNCGFDGIKFRSMEGTDAINYVIFDVNNIRLIDKEEI